MHRFLLIRQWILYNHSILIIKTLLNFILTKYTCNIQKICITNIKKIPTWIFIEYIMEGIASHLHISLKNYDPYASACAYNFFVAKNLKQINLWHVHEFSEISRKVFSLLYVGCRITTFSIKRPKKIYGNSPWEGNEIFSVCWEK